MAEESKDKFYRPERTLAFSDGVIAVAITLLVLDLRLPPLGEKVSSAMLLAALVQIAPKLAMYALSFGVVSMIWIGHHRKFTYIRRVNPRLIEINLVFLMFVGLVPFVTDIVGEYANAAATIIYAPTLTITSLASLATWWYAERTPGLRAETVPEIERREIILSPLLNAGVFAASIPVALWSSTAGRLTWLLLIPGALFASARVQQRRTAASAGGASDPG